MEHNHYTFIIYFARLYIFHHTHCHRVGICNSVNCQYNFLGGAIFVSIINKISSYSIKAISKNDELEKMNNELKTAIADRDKTQELLKISNEELKKINVLVEKKIKERTKELKSDIDQLQRYKDVTVDRELKLIELKKEVNEVLIKHGEKPKYYK